MALAASSKWNAIIPAIQVNSNDIIYIWVSINGGTPKWMVYKGTSQSKMDDDWGYHYFRNPPDIYIHTYIHT